MKKLYILSIIGCLTFTACDQDLDIWDSETLEYSGRFLYELYDENMSEQYFDYSYGYEIRIYNTSDNKINEIWIDDYYLNDSLLLKSKFFLDGDAGSFKSKSSEFSELTNNEVTISPESNPEGQPEGNPESAEDRIEGIPQKYIHCYINEGKIIPKGATTIGGNQADSIFIKLTLCSGTASFKSVFIPEENRTDPNIAYKWEIDVITHDPAKDVTRIISGHRYTGYPEDHY